MLNKYLRTYANGISLQVFVLQKLGDIEDICNILLVVETNKIMDLDITRTKRR